MLLASHKGARADDVETGFNQSPVQVADHDRRDDDEGFARLAELRHGRRNDVRHQDRRVTQHTYAERQLEHRTSTVQTTPHSAQKQPTITGLHTGSVLASVKPIAVRRPGIGPTR